ncbi:hypothetical protein ACQKMK_02160 [Viridibacillus arvi]|uniref:hypothetical protein n=1 Tax=Viridibacillus arvi TaxID=263475 RepID=UPI003CFC8BCC
MKFLMRFLCAFVLLYSIIAAVVPITSHAQSIKVNKSFKSAAKKGQLLGNKGYVGMPYKELKRSVPGKALIAEAVNVYYAKRGGTMYGFEQYNPHTGSISYKIKSTDDVEYISNTYSGKLTHKQMKKYFGHPVGNRTYGTKNKLYKSGVYYIGFRSYKMGKGYITDIAIGTRDMMDLAAFFNGY